MKSFTELRTEKVDSAAKKPIEVEINHKKVTKMVPAKQDIATESVELEESLENMPHDKLKMHAQGVPHGRYTKKEIKHEVDRRKRDGEYHSGYQAEGYRNVMTTHDTELEEQSRGMAVVARAHEMGKKAARQGASYGDNPFDKGSSKHLAWSKGHNKARARMKESTELAEESPLQSAKKKFGEIRYKKNYEAAHKDMMKHGISAADAAKRYVGVDARTLQKRHEAMKEATEQLDELSSNMLRRYVDKAGYQSDNKKDPKAKKREEGEYQASMKIRGKAKVNATEAVEIEEGMFDREKRAFKRKEHEAEYKRDQEIERAKKQKASEPHHVYINGKVWKKDGKPVHFANKAHANKAGLTVQKKDPKKDVKLVHHAYTERNGGVIK